MGARGNNEVAYPVDYPVLGVCPCRFIPHCMKYYFAFRYFPLPLAVLLCGVAGPGWGQGRPALPLNQGVRFTQTAVVPVAGVSQADLVRRAHAWAQRVAPAGQLPVRTSSPGTETVRTTGECPFAAEWGGTLVRRALRYTATVSMRDGRYQYELKEFLFLEPDADRNLVYKTSVETYYNSSHHPYTEIVARHLGAMRTCYQELTDEVLAHLQASMRTPGPNEGGVR